MSLLYLLDTNIATYLATGKFRSVQDHYLAIKDTADVAVSAVTQGELEFGLSRKTDATRLRRDVEDVLKRVRVLPWTSEIAVQYGLLRASTQARGIVLSPLDMMIASHAYALGATLVTHDAALKRLTAYLHVEDWVAGAL